MGKLVAGITGSTIPTATAYLADISSEKEKAKNFGLIGAAFGLGFIFGPLIGGILGEISPRAPFFMSACLAGLNFLFGFFVLPESSCAKMPNTFPFPSSPQRASVVRATPANSPTRS